MMVYDQSGNRKLFTSALTPLLPNGGSRGEQPDHPAAFRAAFDGATDEKQFLSDLEYVLVSIAALLCCMPAQEALSDERVQRMLLSLQGFSTPYLQDRFKQEAQLVANRKSSPAELYIRSRRQSKFPMKFPAGPAEAAVDFLRNDNTRESQSKFFEGKKQLEQQAFEKKLRHEKLRLAKKRVLVPRPPLPKGLETGEKDPVVS